MLQQSISHIAKYQDNKKPFEICANGRILQTFIKPQSCGLIYIFLEKMRGH